MSENTRESVTTELAKAVTELTTALERRAQRPYPPIPDERNPFPAWSDPPDWVPRGGYVMPTRPLLRRVYFGLWASL
ncbi:hypothetical protein ACIRQY_08130 [Streptomyces sp. NPDC101490]|uniref:hypothetical protein n=1 Tax=Streptomyces sp. NPDC101490 TaxID=3366143 RepID=UPI003819A72C